MGGRVLGKRTVEYLLRVFGGCYGTLVMALELCVRVEISLVPHKCRFCKKSESGV